MLADQNRRSPGPGAGAGGTTRPDSSKDDDLWEPLLLLTDPPTPPLASSSTCAAVLGVVQDDYDWNGSNTTPPAAAAGVFSEERANTTNTRSSSSHHFSDAQLRQRRKRTAASGRGGTQPPTQNHRRRNFNNNATPAIPPQTLLLHPRLLLPLTRHLCREIWNNLDWTRRCAVVCGTMGAVFQWVHAVFYYVLYPEWALYTTALCLGVGIPLYMFYGTALQEFCITLQTNPQSLTSLPILRLGVALIGFVLPAVLELRTLHFLIQVVVGDSSAVVPILFFWTVLLLTGKWVAHRHAVVADRNTVAATTPGQGTSWAQNIALDCHENQWLLRTGAPLALYVLYGTALGVVLLGGAERRHIPGLAGRFGWATAVLLYQSSSTSSREDATSRAVRTALRYTVRDALREISTSSSSAAAIPLEELLSWTMLRWLVDYWSTTSTSSTSTASNNRRTRRTAARPDMEWSELWSMLQVTTNQMSTEVEELHRQEEQPDPVTTNPPQPTGLSNDSSPLHPSASASNDESCTLLQASSADNVTTAHLFNNTSSTSSSLPSQQQQRQRPSDNPIHGLQVMLTSINLDERAKPAVLAYQQAVQSVPPSQRTATMLALTRRCPAILLLIFYLMFGWVGLCSTTTWQVLAVLFPFTVLDAWKVYLWIEACKMAPANSMDEVVETSANGWIFDSTVDPMTILLMDDAYGTAAPTNETTDRLPTLLLVWHNVHASVAALQVGLTAARCVQTSVVAVDFAANVLSLVHLGLEMSQHGWWHGVTTVAREWCHLHATGTDPLTLWHGRTAPHETASYTSAAVSAWRNSQTLHRNVRTLADEPSEQWGRVMGAVVALVPLWMGQGWLWGGHNQDPMIQEEPRSNSKKPSTSLEIIELDDDADSGESSDVSLPPETENMAREQVEDAHSALSAVADQASAVAVAQIAISASNSLAQPLQDAVDLHEPGQDAGSMLQSQQGAPSPSELLAHSVTTVNHLQVTDESIVGNVVATSAISASASSSSKIEQSVDQKVGIEIAAKFENDASSLMDLLSYCDEHGIIDQAEKNQILENLAGMSEKKNTSTALAWTFGTKRTLERLISQHKEVMGGSPGDFEPLNLPCGDNDFPRVENNIDALDNDDFESLQFDSPVNGALSVSSDEESTQNNLPPAVIPKSNNGERSLVFDDDSDFEPLHDTIGSDNGSRTKPLHPDQDIRVPNISTTTTIAAVEGSMLEDRDGNDGVGDDGLWLKLGASLALVGAVVGGVALAAGQHSQGEEPKKREGSGTRREDQ